jgi:hypothetical protein
LAGNAAHRCRILGGSTVRIDAAKSDAAVTSCARLSDASIGCTAFAISVV